MPNPNIKDPLLPKQDNSELESIPEMDWRSRLQMPTKQVQTALNAEQLEQLKAAAMKAEASRHPAARKLLVRSATILDLIAEVERLREIEESWNDAVKHGLIIADEPSVTCADCGRKRPMSTLADGARTFVCRYCLSTEPQSEQHGEVLR